MSGTRTGEELNELMLKLGWRGEKALLYNEPRSDQSRWLLFRIGVVIDERSQDRRRTKRGMLKLGWRGEKALK